MEDKKKWTDRDVIIMLSNFIPSLLIMQCTNDVIHEKINIILKRVEYLIEKHKPKTASESTDLLTDSAVKNTDVFMPEAAEYLEAYSMILDRDKENRNE
jgi:hypothetical protein